MNLTRTLVIGVAAFMCTVPVPTASGTAHAGTDWKTRTSEGFDALCALNLLSGDSYYLEKYPEESKLFAAPRYAAARRAAGRLKKVIKDEDGGIVSAFLTLIFSGGPDSTLAAILASARAPASLQSALRESPFWSEDSWKRFERVRPDVIRALESMRRAGFRKDWAVLMSKSKGAPGGADSLAADLARYDVLGEQSRLIGHELQQGRIEVILLHFSRPHGIRVQGGRFLTNIGYPASIVLRNAAHEPLHPPFNASDPGVAKAVAEFSKDSLIVRVVRDHNPSFGYTTVTGYVEEDAVQALEQIVSERLGFAQPANDRWRKGDDGMHLLAAALYDLMRETGFAERGGRFETWFTDMVAAGRLSPGEVDRRARSVLGDEAVDRWKAPGK
ncbi:MAG TPA: hypothetical protein VJW75_00850 [Candidatus Eisenbacteria bacterium]|nr:hypothetical protein [Candidatus Eisenbacteria bacterium]